MLRNLSLPLGMVRVSVVFEALESVIIRGTSCWFVVDMGLPDIS
jgi:hypothetical protein